MKLIVEYGDKKAELAVEPIDTIEFMKFQLFSLTDIAPDVMEITGVAAAGAPAPRDGQQLKSFPLLKDGSVIKVSKRAAGAAAPVAGSGAANAAAAKAAMAGGARTIRVDWQNNCTRVYFNDAKIVQPALNCVGGKVVCVACALTCHLPQDCNPRLSLTPVACECATIPNKSCLFAPRAGAELLHGDAATAVRENLNKAANQHQQQLMAQTMQRMQARVRSAAAAIYEYEDKSLQAKALALIPVDVLKERAEKAIAEAEPEKKLAFRDQLLECLLKWFRGEFFKWTGNLPCDFCGNTDTQNMGGAQPNAEEVKYRAGVVELYKCKSATCGKMNRFPRYNHAGKLLETRRGRCGEWAQAFTLVARAMGYEARHVTDWSDHVWTECYSDDLKRWIHCDSCESSRDNPFLYEAGWNKKLSYILACSAEEVVDVTQRYTRKFKSEVLSRRQDCTEEWFASLVNGLNTERLNKLSAERRSVLNERRIAEVAEFAKNNPPTAASGTADLKAGELVGRSTGSLEWKAARGELGKTPEQVAKELAAAQQKDVKSAPAASCAVPPAASDAAPKLNMKQLLAGYATQITRGCGLATCTSEWCRSAGAKCSVPPPTDKNKVVALCVEWIQKFGQTRLCASLVASASVAPAATATPTKAAAPVTAAPVTPAAGTPSTPAPAVTPAATAATPVAATSTPSTPAVATPIAAASTASSTPAAAAVAAKPAEVSKADWYCEACTMFNDPARSICGTCESPNPTRAAAAAKK